MNKHFWFCLTVLVAGSLLAAQASPQEDVIRAATALSNQTNYSWKTTVEFGLLHTTATRQGRTERNGYTTLFLSSSNATFDAVIKGTNAAILTPDRGWQSAAAMVQDQNVKPGPVKAFARTAQNVKLPAEMAASLAAQTPDLQADTIGISGELSTAGVKTLLGDSLAATANRKVTVTFWITDGTLAKFQWHAAGTVNFNGSSRDMNRTATTEITDVNTTKIEVPAEARKILE